MTKRNFAEHIPEWVRIRPHVDKEWGPFIQNLEGHSSRVDALAISTDGQLLASGSVDKTIRIWDLKSGTCLHTLTQHTGWVDSVAFWNGQRKRILASGSADGTIRIWDVGEGRCIRTLRNNGSAVWSIVFSPRQDKCVLASSGISDGKIKIWDVNAGIVMHTLAEHSSNVKSLAFSPAKSGRLLASASWDSTIRIWDADENTAIQTLTYHNDEVWAGTFSSSAKNPILASGSKQKLKIWIVDPLTYHCTCLHTLKLDSCPVSLSFSENGQLACTDNITIKVWNAQKGTHSGTISGHSSQVTSTVFSLDGRFVIGSTIVGLIRVLEAVQSSSSSPGKFIGEQFSLQCLSNGYVAGSGLNFKIPIWNSTSRPSVRTISVSGDDQVLAHCPKTGFLASGSYEESIKIWDPATGGLQNEIEIDGRVRALSYSNDGLRLAAITSRGGKAWGT
ncbi:hypothetical protein FVEG_17288 [Fusarium verticillioides 7600]|uniref:Uncharacterized protein n=1 Tax=Gibberella moniliformis (strain M3125 / FGSC 7600) TaxID=334819 RepID=W7N2A6_GIBM7|nr:hypothetical protein FVEG_17288 [Fusarium verticillioides 7600]EWG54259.1 hypothetical protein FVEG_17288 [Fusarium verticillioides 7600]